MGLSRKERKERQRAKRAEEAADKPPLKREPKVPMEKWSVERPFDSSEYLTRAAQPTYEDAES